MTNGSNRLESLVEQIRRKNTLEPPMATPVALEVRTAIGFSVQGGGSIKELLADRPGATAFRVVWQYRVLSSRLNDFSLALLDSEKDMFDATRSGTIKYLGTYVIRIDPEDPPLFVTTWGCATEDEARIIGRGPWTGPPGGEAAYMRLFSPDFFNHGKAQITSQGLAVATDVTGGGSGKAGTSSSKASTKAKSRAK
jgi:hypothetical protein